MKRIIPVVVLAILLFAASVPSHAQQPIEPSEEHKKLKNDIGTWDAVMQVYLAGPDAEPTEVRAVETNAMLGDFWLVSSLEYEMLGQKMTGRGQFGFDPSTQKYIGTWCDSGSPYMSTLEGSWNEAEQSFTYTMNGRDEAGNPTRGKLITKIVNPDRKTFVMYLEVPGTTGQYVKIMEVVYTRRK